MGRTEPELDVALDHLKRALDNQLGSLSELQGKVGTALGFSITGIGLLFAFGRAYIGGHPTPAVVSAVFLLAGTILLTASFLSFFVLDVPDPDWLLLKLNDPRVSLTDLKEALVSNYAGAYDSNARGAKVRLISVDVGIGTVVIGVAVFLVGVLLPG